MTTFEVTATGPQVIERNDVEDFLYHEAALLDSWRLTDWLGLFEEGARYEVPATDLRGGESAAGAQYLVGDSWHLLQARVKRLNNPNAHAENPRSRTRHLVTNVRIIDRSVDSIKVEAGFHVLRIRDGHIDPYVGHYEHLLAVRPEGLRFRLRRAVLDHEALRPGGRLSIIL